jgi:hypothetical protein
MAEPTHTPHPVWLRRGLVGLGIGFLAAVILVMFLIHHKVTQDVDDPVAMRKIILQAVPIGSSVDDAQRFMEQQGFTCNRKTNASYQNLKGIDFLSCGRSEGMIVHHDWSVVIIHRNAKLTDVLTNLWLTGP